MFRFWIFSKHSSNVYCVLNSCFISDPHFLDGLCILFSGVFEATVYVDVSKQFAALSCNFLEEIVIYYEKEKKKKTCTI